MSGFPRNNWLALNGATTQLMIGGAKDMDVSNIIVVVDSAEIRLGNTLELLGVSFDRKFTVKPYLSKLTKEARFLRGTTRTTSPPRTTATTAWERTPDGQGGTLPARHRSTEAARLHQADPRNA
jgi:hypothetical protein